MTGYEEKVPALVVSVLRNYDLRKKPIASLCQAARSTSELL